MNILKKNNKRTNKNFTIKVLALIPLIEKALQQDLVTFSHRVSTARYSFSATSYGEKVVYTNRNNLYYSNVFKSPYTESSIRLSDSSSEYSVHISDMSPYLVVADILGKVYILNQNDNLGILKKFQFNAQGRARFFRSHIHGFKGTNYFYLTNRQSNGVGGFFHDWSKEASEVKHLTSDSEILRFSSYEGVNMILSVENFSGKKIMKIDPTISNDVISRYVHTEEIGAMISLKEVSGVGDQVHFANIEHSVSPKISLYNSVSDIFSNEKTSVNFNYTIDILPIEGTNYVGLASITPEAFSLIKVPEMDVWSLDYGNGNDNFPNYMRVFTYLKNTEYLWFGKDFEFDLYKINPPVCHKTCGTCSKAALVEGCLTCQSGYSKIGDYCLESNCQNSSNPYYFPETESCGYSCGNGYYEEPNKICRSCIQNCERCSNKLKCDTCQVQFQLDEDNLCVKKCSTGEYYSSGSCLSCHSTCQSCNGGGANKCTICPGLDGVNSDGTCSVYCGDNQFFNEITGQCENCKSQCQDCKILDSCSSCKIGYNEIKKDDGTMDCLISCPEGYYTFTDESGIRKCQKCPSGCSVCSYSSGVALSEGKVTCSSCFSDYYFYNTSCYSECPEGTRLDIYSTGVEKYCLNCPENCLSCGLDTSSGYAIETCQKCSEGYFLYVDICYFTCPSGTFEDESQDPNQCSPCISGCRICSNIDKCTLCNNGFELQEDNFICKYVGYQIPDENNNTDEEAGGSIVGVIIFMVFIIVIMTVLCIVLYSIKKRQLEQEARDRRERRRRTRRLRGIPRAQPFHPIIPEGERNPLEPLENQIQELNSEQIYSTIPFKPSDSALNPESLIEINVNGVEKEEESSGQGVVRMIKREEDVQIKEKKSDESSKFYFPYLFLKGSSKKMGDFETGAIDINQVNLQIRVPRPYIPPNLSANGPRIEDKDKRILKMKVLVDDGLK